MNSQDIPLPDPNAQGPHTVLGGKARYYNPAIARFTQEDEYRGDGLNLYAYCANNPVMYVDPSGYSDKPCTGKKQNDDAPDNNGGPNNGTPNNEGGSETGTRAGGASSAYRKASLRKIKRQLGIPMSEQPVSQKMVPLTDSNGNWILNDNKQPIMTRELTYDVNGKKIVIQDHSAGHKFGEGGIGDQPSHHNVRPAENTRTGKVEGVEDHYYFDNRNSK